MNINVQNKNVFNRIISVLKKASKNISMQATIVKVVHLLGNSQLNIRISVTYNVSDGDIHLQNVGDDMVYILWNPVFKFSRQNIYANGFRSDENLDDLIANSIYNSFLDGDYAISRIGRDNLVELLDGTGLSPEDMVSMDRKYTYNELTKTKAYQELDEVYTSNMLSRPRYELFQGVHKRLQNRR